MEGKAVIFKDTLSFSAATVVVQGFAFVLAIYLRRELGPEAIGVWTLLQVYLTYLAYANLGLFGSVYRKIPVLRGAGEEAKIRSIKNTAFTYVACSSTLVTLLVVAGALFFRSKLSPLMFYGLITLAVINILQRANNYQIQILYSDKKFVFVSEFKVWSALFNAAITFFFVWKGGLYGLYGATILSYLFNVIYLIIRAKLRFSFTIHKAELQELLAFGIPLLILGFTTKFYHSLDKLVIAKFLSVEDLGVYSVAMMASNTLFLIPSVFHIVLFPRTLERFGEEKNVAGREKYSTKPGQIVALFFSLGIGIFWIGAPSFCASFLPQYVKGLPALKILLFGSAFSALAEQMGHILLGYKRHLWMLPVYIGLSAGLFGGSLLAIKLGGDLAQVAMLTSLSYFFSYLLSSYFALSPLYSIPDYIRYLLCTLFPLGFSLLALFTIESLLPGKVLLVVFTRAFVYLALWFIPVLLMERELRILKSVREALGGIPIAGARRKV